MIKKLALRVGSALLGMVVVLAWWTYRGSTNTETSSHIPTSVWGGGPAKIAVDVESTSPATMRISFNEREKPTGEQKLLETWEKMPAGSKTFAVEAPARVGGYIEFEADQPKPGDKLKWRVTINGHVVGQEEEVLDKPLEPNTAFFLQLHFDDYSDAQRELSEEEEE